MKTEQQKRFEVVWNASDGCDSVPQPWSSFPCFDDGSYIPGAHRVGFKMFTAGEASGLALAAAECDKQAAEHKEFAETEEESASRNCAYSIRALMTEGVKP